jgi:hypothetical protein
MLFGLTHTNGILKPQSAVFLCKQNSQVKSKEEMVIARIESFFLFSQDYMVLFVLLFFKSDFYNVSFFVNNFFLKSFNWEIGLNCFIKNNFKHFIIL